MNIYPFLKRPRILLFTALCTLSMACTPTQPELSELSELPESDENPNAQKAAFLSGPSAPTLRSYSASPLHNSLNGVFYSGPSFHFYTLNAPSRQGMIPPFHLPFRYPQAPMVHFYNLEYFVMDPSFALGIPSIFRANVPSAIRDQMATLDIQSLDLFVVVQPLRKNDRLHATYNNSLKSAFWAFPEAPFFRDVRPPLSFLKSVQMSVHPTERSATSVSAAVDSTLRTFNPNLHDGTVSPNEGHLNIPHSLPDEPVEFYSLVYIPTAKRAAVTLHCLLPAGFPVGNDALGHPTEIAPGSAYEQFSFFLHDSGPMTTPSALLVGLERIATSGSPLSGLNTELKKLLQ